MSEKNQKYESEFKIKVAKEALAKDKKDLEPLSEQYGVPVSLILTWAVQLEEKGEDSFTAESDSDIESNDKVDLKVGTHEVSLGLQNGVMSDNLNYRRLGSWTVVGVIVVLVFMQMLVEIFKVEKSREPEQIAGEHAFYKVTTKKDKAQEKISSFGIVDEENNVYRVPVDMVIEQMAEAPNDSTKKNLIEKVDPTPVE